MATARRAGRFAVVTDYSIVVVRLRRCLERPWRGPVTGPRQALGSIHVVRARRGNAADPELLADPGLDLGSQLRVLLEG